MPRENFARPAIDPTFRSMALAFGDRVIGIILSGRLDDGALGLKAVKLVGGLAIVQDPQEAVYPDMPTNALKAVKGAAKATINDICQIVGVEVGKELNVNPPSEHQTMREFEIEAAIASGDLDALAGVSTLGKPVPVTCPECGGTLFEIGTHLQRYRCHTGHAFSPTSLIIGAENKSESAMWSAIRVLQEEALLLTRLAHHSRNVHHFQEEQKLLSAADRKKALADRVRELLKASYNDARVLDNAAFESRS